MKGQPAPQPASRQVIGEMYVLNVIPPPELHLLMKIITEISNVLCKEPDVALWLRRHGVIWHGYNGGGLDGRNANKIRKLLPDLEIFILDNFSSYHPVVERLKSFSIGKFINFTNYRTLEPQNYIC